MRKQFLWIAGGLFLLAILITPSVIVHAAGPMLTATPTSGPPGTVFKFVGSGFPANIMLNLWAVEPDGIASTAGWNYDLPDRLKTDERGSVSFTWMSATEDYAYAFGPHRFVLSQPAPGGAIGLRADAVVNLTGKSILLSGAKVTADKSRGREFLFTFSGFMPGEPINTWVTFPPNCSSSWYLPPFSALSTNDMYADAKGEASLGGEFDEMLCLGTYAITGKGGKSGRTGAVSFEITGNPITVNSTLKVTVVNSPYPLGGADQAAPYVSMHGTGFGPDEVINCWSTRPDGVTFPEPWLNYYGLNGTANSFQPAQIKTDRNGVFTEITSVGSVWIPGIASEEPGQWALTCKGMTTGRIGVDTFWIGPSPSLTSSMTAPVPAATRPMLFGTVLPDP